MSMSDDEFDLLRHGLSLMNARKALDADVFYDRLFEFLPEVRPMFGDDILAQTEKVVIALGAIVAQIQSNDACRAMSRELAIRHVDYGVEAWHYSVVGEAVMITFTEVLDADFTPEMEAVWRKAYDVIAGAMIESAYGVPEQSAA